MARLERTRRERDAAAVEAALRGLRDAAATAGLERDEPDAALHPVRRRVRDARRAVRASCAGSSASTASPVAV